MVAEPLPGRLLRS